MLIRSGLSALHFGFWFFGRVILLTLSVDETNCEVTGGTFLVTLSCCSISIISAPLFFPACGCYRRPCRLSPSSSPFWLWFGSRCCGYQRFVVSVAVSTNLDPNEWINPPPTHSFSSFSDNRMNGFGYRKSGLGIRCCRNGVWYVCCCDCDCVCVCDCD